MGESGGRSERRARSRARPRAATLADHGGDQRRLRDGGAAMASRCASRRSRSVPRR